jgi:hypothetical protein
MNSPNHPQQGGPQGQYGPPQGQPYGGPPPQTPPGGQSYGTPPQGQPYGGPPPQDQPYGGPPPQGQPFGGPAPAGPAGPGGAPPVGYATPPPPPPAAKPKNTGKIIKIVLGVVVIAVIAVVAIVNWGTSPSSANVGDCIKVNTVSVTDADIEKIDCGDPAASYKVAATFDDSSAQCPGGSESDYVSYTESGKGDLTLCLTLNAKEGECFKNGDAAEKVSCASADVKVAKILKGTTDESGCPEETVGFLAYPDPKMVLCLSDPAGGTA